MKPKQNGRDVTRERAHGEPERIQYDPDRHPGIIKRLLLAGYGDTKTAAVLGITPETLRRWFAKYPALDECRVEARMREADLVDTAHRMALGEYDDKAGHYKGGDAGMLKFILERRYGWVTPAMAAKGKPPAKELPDDERLPELLQPGHPRGSIGRTARCPVSQSQ